MKAGLRRVAVAALLVVGMTTTLTACDDSERKTPIELGKECFAAGGTWRWSDWTGYSCEFIQPEDREHD